MDSGSGEGAPIGEGLEIVERANALWRPGPDCMKNSMKQLAALCGGEAGLGWLPALCGEARIGEGLEWALRLIGEDAGAAFDFAGRKGAAGAASSAGRSRGFKASCSMRRE
jgi:hypothetical protein